MTALCPCLSSPLCPCPCCGCDGGEICALSCATSSFHDCGSDAFCQSAHGCVSCPCPCPGSYKERDGCRLVRKQVNNASFLFCFFKLPPFCFLMQWHTSYVWSSVIFVCGSNTQTTHPSQQQQLKIGLCQRIKDEGSLTNWPVTVLQSQRNDRPNLFFFLDQLRMCK